MVRCFEFLSDFMLLSSFKMLIRKSDFGGFLPWVRLVCDTNVHLAEAEIRGFFRRARFVCATNVHLAEAGESGLLPERQDSFV